MREDRGVLNRRAAKAAGLALSAALLAMSVPGPAAAAAAVNGKWVTILLPAEPPGIDACFSSRSYAGRVIKYTLSETLVQKTADGALKPMLATSWQQLDPLTWRLKLREGVTFHDGAPLTAETVKRSLDRENNPAIGADCADLRKFFAGLPFEAKAIDATTLEIKTARPESILPMRLTGLVVAGPNTPMDKLTPSGQGPVGTGPFVFDSWQAGQQILFKRNDKYWGPKPAAEGVRYIWRSESAVRAAMVKLGEADIAHSISQEDATDPKMDVSYLNSETTYLRLDTEKAPLNDKRVRKALRLALDHDALIGTIMPKTAMRATQVVFPSIPGHNHALDKKKSYDPARAKQLLAEARAAGVPVDTPMDFISSISEYPNAQEAAEAIHGMWTAVGLNTKLMVLESGEYGQFEAKPYKEDRQPMILQSSHDNNFGDPVFSVIYKYGCDGATAAYCDPAFDKEVGRVSTLAGEERLAAWQELFRSLYEDIVADIPLFHMVAFTRVNPRINFVPDVSTTNEIRVGEITFK